MKKGLRAAFLITTLFVLSESIFGMRPRNSYCGYFVWSTMRCYNAGCENCTAVTLP
jgi:hypothetical protein